MKLALLVLTANLVACGSNSGGDPAPKAQQVAPEQQPYSMAVTEAVELPACDAAHDKQLVYVMDTKEFQTCQSGTWTKIDISITPAVDPVAEAKAVRNALVSIELGQTFASVPSKARDALLGSSAEVTERADEGCAAQINKVYNLLNYGPDKFSYSLSVFQEKVVMICPWADGENPGCRRAHTGCA